METLQFNVSGEFITNLARTWFWDENRPLKTVDELLRCCIQCDDENTVNTIICQILEGHKKFIGTNDFELVNDNEHIRPLIQKFTQNERKAGINAIKLDMMTRFIRYVDKWSTIKSMHSDVLTQHNNPTSYKECLEYFTTTHNSNTYEDEPIFIKTSDTTETRLFDTPTRGGLWLIDYPDLCYDACNGDLQQIGKKDFWQYIYEQKKNDPDFKNRTERYEFSMRPKPSIEERMQNLINATKSAQSQDKEPTFLSKEWFDYQWQHTKEYQYLMEPDNITHWEGLIAPNGDFYSCEFGSHNTKAYHILVYYPEWFGRTSEDFITDNSIRCDNALDVLLEHGWCATRSVMFDQYILPPLPKKPTKAQCQCIMDAIEKHDAKINIDELISYL